MLSQLFLSGLERKIILALLVLLLSSLTAFAVFYSSIEKINDDAFIIGAFAQQNTLVERYGRDLFYFEETQMMGEVGKTIKIFEGNLNALRDGGILEIDKNTSVVIEKGKYQSKEIMRFLNQIQGDWEEIKNFAGVVISGNDKKENYTKMVNLLTRLSNKLSTTVIAYQKESEHKLQFVKKVQVVTLMISLLIFIVIFLYVRIKVISSLNKVITQIAKASQNVLEISKSVDKISEDLSLVSKQQESLAQDTVSAVTKMSTMVERNDAHVAESKEYAGQVKSKVEDGSGIILEMDRSFSDIERAKAKLQEIINIINTIVTKNQVVDELADKTKILSFNAAIEAARAGLHGKSFAVVASEIRKLAMVSGKAAEDIQGLLTDSRGSVSKIVGQIDASVDANLDVAKKSAEIFNEIVSCIENMNTKNKLIVETSSEHKLGVEHTVKAMELLEKSVQETRDLIAKTVGSIKELKGSGENLEFVTKQLEQIVYKS
ncbi:MAG: hypothetical protein HQK50_11865 [Oligoflexia bacterium]|nr:hypothetical protein [Oligoflexia bacterium]MBF0366260.1 hypothetical protein [Oligoflexia bacterium]